MTEEEAIRKIREDCHSGDLEMNGSLLDKILDDFLRTNGLYRLADEIESVECWRA